MRIEEAVEQKDETVMEVLQPPPALVKEADVKPLSMKRNLESEKIGRLGYLKENTGQSHQKLTARLANTVG